jgi:hypothetical protein
MRYGFGSSSGYRGDGAGYGYLRSVRLEGGDVDDADVIPPRWLAHMLAAFLHGFLLEAHTGRSLARTSVSAPVVMLVNRMRGAHSLLLECL